MKKKQIYLVIPVYNECKVISEVIDELKKNKYSNIIIVDDGSEDDSFIKISKHKTFILRHILNRGKGAAIKTGIEAAKIMNADMVVTFDADGQHDPKDLKGIIDLIDNGFDVVLGKRNFRDTHIPLFKKTANMVGNILTFLLYGLWVNDSQSGLRGYSKNALACIKTQSDRYEYDSEVIREISRNNLKWVEYPIRVRYTKYSQSKLHKQNMTNGIKTVWKMITGY